MGWDDVIAWGAALAAFVFYSRYLAPKVRRLPASLVLEQSAESRARCIAQFRREFGYGFSGAVFLAGSAGLLTGILSAPADRSPLEVLGSFIIVGVLSMFAGAATASFWVSRASRVAVAMEKRGGQSPAGREMEAEARSLLVALTFAMSLGLAVIIAAMGMAGALPLETSLLAAAGIAGGAFVLSGLLLLSRHSEGESNHQSEQR